MRPRIHKRIYTRLIMEVARRDCFWADLENAIGVCHSSMLNKLRGKSEFTLTEAITIKEYLNFPGTLEQLFRRDETGG